MYDALDDQLFQTLNNLNINYMKPILLIVYNKSVDIPDIAVSPKIDWILSSKGVTKQSAGKLPPPVFLFSRFSFEIFPLDVAREDTQFLFKVIRCPKI